MAQEQPNTQNQDQSLKAYNTLVDKVYGPVFREKLASDYGIVPRTQEEWSGLLELAGFLRNREEQTKTASAHNQGSLILEATDNLKRALSATGEFQGALTSQDMQIKQAAANVVQRDPAIMQAALEYGNFISQMLDTGNQAR